MTSSNVKELPLEALMPLITEQLAQGKSVRLSPRGTSMLPLLREGKDSVVLSPLPAKIKKYDVILYRRPDGSYVLHRVLCVKENSFTCIGDHQFEAEEGVLPQSLLAVATAFIRSGKTFSVCHPFYRWYCKTLEIRRFLRRMMQMK